MVWSLTLSVVLFRFRGLNVVVAGVLVCLLGLASWHFANSFKPEKKTYMHSRRYTHTHTHTRLHTYKNSRTFTPANTHTHTTTTTWPPPAPTKLLYDMIKQLILHSWALIFRGSLLGRDDTVYHGDNRTVIVCVTSRYNTGSVSPCNFLPPVGG